MHLMCIDLFPQSASTDGDSPLSENVCHMYPLVHLSVDVFPQSVSSEEDSPLSEIEEDLGVRDSLEPPKPANHNRKVLFKPKDAVVLDFGAKKGT